MLIQNKQAKQFSRRPEPCIEKGNHLHVYMQREWIKITVVWKYFRIPKLFISLSSDRPFHIAPAKTIKRPTAHIP